MSSLFEVEGGGCVGGRSVVLEVDGVGGRSVVLEVDVEGGGCVVLEVEVLEVEVFPPLLRLLSSACCNLALARLLCLTMRCNRKAISSIVSSSTFSILSNCLLIDLYSAILSRIKYINNCLNVYLNN